MEVNLTVSIDDNDMQKARRHAEALGTSVDQLVREYVRQLAGKRDAGSIAAEFAELSRASRGNSDGWKFIREELHDRK